MHTDIDLQELAAPVDDTPDGPPKIPYKNLLAIRHISNDIGAHSVIYTAVWENRQVIIKKLKQNRVNAFNNEADLLHEAKHPNIVGLLGIVNEQVNNTLMLAFVLETVERGDLFEYLLKHHKPGAGRHSIRKVIAREALSAIAFLHSINILHRDIKCENILLDAGYHVKVADFGFAAKLKPEQTDYYSEKFEGTMGWFDPALCQYVADKGHRYGKDTDVYSCAILLSVLFSDDAVSYSDKKTPAALERAVYNGEHPYVRPEIPSSTVHLLSLCWQKNHRLRPTVQEMLEHPALNDNRPTVS